MSHTLSKRTAYRCYYFVIEHSISLSLSLIGKPNQSKVINRILSGILVCSIFHFLCFSNFVSRVLQLTWSQFLGLPYSSLKVESLFILLLAILAKLWMFLLWYLLVAFMEYSSPIDPKLIISHKFPEVKIPLSLNVYDMRFFHYYCFCFPH